MTPVHIRLATPADADTVAPLFDAYRQFYEQAPDLAGAKAFIAERLEREESVILLALDASQTAVGFCQLYPTFCSVEAAPIYRCMTCSWRLQHAIQALGAACCWQQKPPPARTARCAWT